MSNAGPLGFLFGGMSCMAAAMVTHPVDTIKVRLQLQGEPVGYPAAGTGAQATTATASTAAQAAVPKKYNGFLRGMATVVREEGVGGLYKGISASLLREGTYSTIRIGLYEPFKNALATATTGRDEPPRADPLWKKVVAGGAAGAVGSAIANPTDLLKVRMQASTGKLPAGGVLRLAADVFRAEGLRGLYRGVGPNTQRAIVLTGTQLPSYDHFKHLLLASGYFSEGVATHFVCSMFAGLVCATTTSPIDVVKARYMNQKYGPDGVGLKYSSTFDCFRKTVQGEGFMALYKGWFPQWMRIGPHTIVTFMILEQLRKLAGLNPV
ncbi:mitochondrial carrier domain-containing protein [Entophlyctis helioformis]|nr:mitochondrial carrier domain-containing protein [Entophlyctis helioformis]